MAVTEVIADLVGLLLNCIFLGVLVILYCMSIHFWLKRSPSNRPLFTLITSTILVLFSVLFVAFHISFALDAPFGSPAVTEWFAQTGDWRQITESVLIAVAGLLADIMLIYRCWIVWSKRWLPVLLPLVIWCATVATTSCTMWELILITARLEGLFAPQFERFSMASMGMSLILNIFVTGLILYRIWLARSLNAVRGLAPIVYAIVESGSLYVVTLLVWMILGLKGSFGYNVILGCMVPIYGIVFTLLLVRVGIRTDNIERSSRDSGTSRSINPSFSMGRRSQPIVVSIVGSREDDGSQADLEKAQSTRSESIATAV